MKAKHIGAVYLITNQLDGKYYVGQTYDLGSRMIKLRYDAGKRKDLKIAAAINECGERNFMLETLALESDKKRRHMLEKLWIIALRSFDPALGYNTCVGYLLPRETRLAAAPKIAATLRKNRHNRRPEWLIAMNADRKGQPMSEENKAKLRKPKNLSPEARERRREIARRIAREQGSDRLSEAGKRGAAARWNKAP